MTVPRPALTCCWLVFILCAFWPGVSGCKGGGDGGSSPSAPSPSPGGPSEGPSGSSVGRLVIDPGLSSVSGARGSYVYTVKIGVRESGGASVTVNAVEVTFYQDQGHGAQIIQFTFIGPEAMTSTRVNANGTAQTKNLVMTDPNPEHPYALNLQVRMSYTDDAQRTGTTTGFLVVPPLP